MRNLFDGFFDFVGFPPESFDPDDLGEWEDYEY